VNSIKNLAAETKRAIAAQLQGQEHLTLLFDGGTVKNLGLHIVVVTLVSSEVEFVLPPIVFEKGQTINSVKLTNRLVLALKEFNVNLSQIRFVCVDGCRVNKVVTDAIGDLVEIQKFLHATDEVAPAPHEVTEEFMYIIQSFLKDTLRCSNVFLCRGHYLKTVVDKVLDIVWKDTEAYRFAKLFSQSLHEAPTRNTRLRSFLKEKREEKEKGMKSTRDSILGPLTNLITRLGLQHVALVDVVAVLAPLRKFPDCKSLFDGPPFSATDVLPRLKRFLKEYEEKYEEIAQSKPPPLATINATRWHSSVYATYVFLSTNLRQIGMFYNEDSKKTQKIPNSIYNILEMLQTNGEQDGNGRVGRI